MKPLLPAVVAICLVISSYAHPENIEEVKGLPQNKELNLEAEESEPQARKERCTTCSSGNLKLNIKSHNDVLAALQALPGAEVHTQQSYESCSSDKGCAGLKIKDGAVVERFGNVESFKAAVAADGGNEFQFHPGGALGEAFFANPPFWWMNQNSPFKAGGGNFEKFSKSSSSFSTTGSGGGAGGAGFGGSIDLAANPFLNGDFSKVAGGFAGGAGGEAKPSSFQSSSFESSSFSSSNKDLDLSKNPFLNGGIKFSQGGLAAQGGFGSSQFGAGATGSGASSSQGSFGASQGQSQGGFGQNNFNAGGNSGNAQFGGQFSQSSSSKFGGGYTGSSPSPFTAAAGGSNVNLIQNTQKATEFDYEQQQNQNIDEAFQSTGNVHAHEHSSGGELQQTCAGQGYVCVHKAQCNNGVVNTNGAGVLAAKTQKQYCNIKTEICCRMEITSLSGAGNQGSLGVGSATYSGSGAQGSGLFVAGQSGKGQSTFSSGSNSFGQSGSAFGQSGQGQSGQASQSGQANFGAFGAKGTFGQGSTGQSAFGQGSTGQSAFGQGSTSQSAFGQGSTSQSAFGQGSQSTFGQGNQRNQGNQGSQQGAFESSSTGFSASGTFGSSNSANRGSGSTGFEAGFNSNKFASGSGSSSFGAGAGFSTPAPSNRFGGGNVNEVYKSTSQSNFIETDSFSAGSEVSGNFRPGASGSGLKPGIPYLPPVDNVNQPTVISSTAVPVYTPRPTTPRPVTQKPTYRPVTSTSAPGYLPPEQSDSSNQKETRIPGPPTYVDGSLILDETITARPTPGPAPSEIPAGCAAALKCTPIEYCTAEGVISNTTVVLTRDQEAYRVPLTDCKDLESGRIGKCCRDPLYTDPWPTNQLGKWVSGVFGGNDGKYVPDSRGSGNNPRPQVTIRPPTTGNIILNSFRPTPAPFRPNQGFGTAVGQKGQFEIKGQGQYSQGGQGQYSQGGQGQYSQGGQGQYEQGGQFGVASQGGTQLTSGSQFTSNTQAFKGQGQITSQGQGAQVSRGQGQIVTQGQGQLVTQGQGQIVTQGQGQLVSQGQGQIVSQGQGQYVERGQGFQSGGGRGQFAVGGQGQLEIQGGGAQGQFSQFSGQSQKQFGQGQIVSQGQGTGVINGQGQAVTQGQGFGVVTGQGQAVSQGQGFGVVTGQGQTVSQGQGFGVIRGQGSAVSQGQGSLVSQGQGSAVSQGQGAFGVSGQGFEVSGGIGTGYRQGFGQGVVTGQGQIVSQGFGSGIRRGFGQAIVQGEGQTSASDQVYRVFLGQYGAGSGQCGVLNGQKPYGNRNDLEVDFAEIPWQAMVLLQTNRSLLCGGVITRPDVVVTSASCVEGLDAKNVLIKGGEWKLGIDDEPLPFQIVQVKTILRHPFYKAGSLKYDAAILVLSENLRLAKNIYPICLPGSSDTLDAFYNGAGECIVTGWGKQVLQAHLSGSIMHSLNVSLINPGECQAKLNSDYPHLLEQYDQESCACGQPLNPVNNICKVDIGSALACTTDNEHYVLRGIYSWDSGCQTGNQLAAFYKFDLEWYEWAIGLIESVRFAKYTVTTKVTTNRFSGQLSNGAKGQYNAAIKGSSVSGASGSGISGSKVSSSGFSSSGFGSGISGSKVSSSGFSSSGFGSGISGSKLAGSGLSASGNALSGNGAVSSQAAASSGQFGFSQFGSSKFSEAQSNGFNAALTAPITNSFSATYSEKKVFQTEPKIFTYTTKPEIVTYTTKPEIVTFTTKPEYFTFTTKPKLVTYTTKPKIVTYTTKPQIITYETSGTGNNPQYVAPGVTFNPGFSEIAGVHKHNAQCKCLENGKK